MGWFHEFHIYLCIYFEVYVYRLFLSIYDVTIIFTAVEKLTHNRNSQVSVSDCVEREYDILLVCICVILYIIRYIHSSRVFVFYLFYYNQVLASSLLLLL